MTDVRTMLVVMGVSSLLMALLLMLAFAGRSRDGLAKWVGALTAHGCAWLLYALPNALPDLLSVVIANTIFALGWALKAASLVGFQHRRIPHWLPWAPPALTAVLFLGLQGNAQAVMIADGLVFAAASAAIAWLLWRLAAATKAMLRWMMTGIYCIATAGFLLRTYVALNHPEIMPGALAPGGFQTFTNLLGYALIVASSFGILLMHKERADAASLRLASFDPLTGAYNRRSFIDLAERELARADRNNTPVSLLMLDLDRFKQINDQYGHQAGDEVLRCFTAVVQSCLRKSDVLVRYGGEEFCVLLPGNDCAGATTLAERIRHEVSEVRIVTRGERVQVTVSIGLATAAAGDDNLELLLSRADNALYQAKQSGRNRVEFQLAA